MKLHLIERDGTGQQVFEVDMEYPSIPQEYVGQKITKYYESRDDYLKDRNRLESLRESIINSIGEDKIDEVLSSISPIGALYNRGISISPMDYMMIFKSGVYIYSVN